MLRELYDAFSWTLMMIMGMGLGFVAGSALITSLGLEL